MTNKNKNYKVKNNPVKIFFITILSILLFLVSFIFINNIKVNNKYNTIQTVKTIKSTNDEEHTYWPEMSVEQIEFRTLISTHLPEESNITEMVEWARTYNVDPDSEVEPTAFVNYSLLYPEFNWSNVGFATTGQFKQFLTFFGKNDGLKYFTSITFKDVGIDFSLPEFWLSLDHYMPNLTSITIESEAKSPTLTSLPKEIGKNRFKQIVFKNQNIGDQYENFLAKDYPIANIIQKLTIKNCNIKDHIVTEETDEDKSYYFTDVIFSDASSLTSLLKVEITGNKFQHVKGNLLLLPKVVHLDLSNNAISKWHCIGLDGKETSSGLSQICFPNPSRISYVNVSGNNLYELVHLTPKEWNTNTIETYKNMQENRYPRLNFVDISCQTVTKKLFVFGNNTSLGNNEADTYSDMNIDLSNIFVMPEDLSENEMIQYIQDCLNDRVKNRNYGSDADRWINLTLTDNVMPSMINLFASKCNYFNNYPQISILNSPDYVVSGQDVTQGVHDNELRDVNYYCKQELTHIEEGSSPVVVPEPTDSPCYFSTETSSTVKMNDSTYGSKVTKQCPGSVVEYEEFGWTEGIASDYDSSYQCTVNITPKFYINVNVETEIVKQSKYEYRIQIFNAENYIFYLNKVSEINDYIKSIADKDITVDDVYTHFYDLIYYSGNANKWQYFKDNFNDREYWNINAAYNNRNSRRISISISYYAYQFIGTQQETPTKLNLIITIETPAQSEDNRILILEIIWGSELILLLTLLIALIVFIIRTKSKANRIALEKQEKISKKPKDSKEPEVEIEKDETKEQKLSKKQIRENIFKKNDPSKTEKVIVAPKEDKNAQEVIEVDDVLKDLE